jgi:hypothetical protein
VADERSKQLRQQQQQQLRQTQQPEQQQQQHGSGSGTGCEHEGGLGGIDAITAALAEGAEADGRQAADAHDVGGTAAAGSREVASATTGRNSGSRQVPLQPPQPQQYGRVNHSQVQPRVGLEVVVPDGRCVLCDLQVRSAHALTAHFALSHDMFGCSAHAGGVVRLWVKEGVVDEGTGEVISQETEQMGQGQHAKVGHGGRGLRVTLRTGCGYVEKQSVVVRDVGRCVMKDCSAPVQCTIC